MSSPSPSSLPSDPGIERRKFLLWGAAAAGLSITPRLPAAVPRPARVGQAFLLPEDFGADTAAPDNSAALQRGLEASAELRIPFLMSQDYDTQNPVYIPAHAHWMGRGKIRNTRSEGPNGLKITVLAGNYHPAHWSQLSYLNGNPVGAGDRSMVLTDPHQITELKAGDLVFCRSQEFWEGHPNITHPIYGSFNLIDSVDAATGRVVLQFPWLRAVEHPQIALANNDIIDQQKLRSLYCCYDAKVEGIRVESVHGNSMARGGSLKCDFHYAEIKSLTGAFANALSFTRLRVDAIICDRKILDVAGCAVGSEVEILTAAYRKTARSTNSGLVTHNESVCDNVIRIQNLTVEGFDYPNQNLVRFGMADGCELTITKLIAPSAQGTVVTFANLPQSEPYETQPTTRENRVTIKKFVGGSALQHFATFNNAGGKLDGCSLTGDFEGRVSGAAVDCDGAGHTLKGVFRHGVLDLSKSTGTVIDAIAPDGIVGYAKAAGHIVRLNGSDPVS